MLGTTPFHLRALVAADVALPALERVLCATAPLSLELAREAEMRYAAPVVEIYGCTETGQLATRRVTADHRWLPFEGVAVDVRHGSAFASGDAIGHDIALADRIALAGDGGAPGRFELVGRSADLVNIAGKRTSLGHLNAQLLAVDGVVDGCYYRPDDDASESERVSRLGAVVVAPTLTPSRLLQRLRERVDAAFLPRPLHFVDRLPRNATGKLTDAALRDAVAASTTVPLERPTPARRDAR